MKPLQVAIIGANGRFGHKRLKALLMSEDRVVVVCDSHFNRVDEVCKKFNKPVSQVTHYSEVMAYKPDVVFVSTPDFLKNEIIIYFLNQGVHVLAEKPLSLNVSEVEKYYDIARKQKVVLYTGYNLIHSPGVSAALEFCKKNDFGKVLRARMMYGHGASKNLLLQNDWRVGDQSWGGSLVDMGCHLLHLVGDFIEYDFKEIYVKKSSLVCKPPIEDNCYAMFEAHNGCCIEISTSWTSVRSLFGLEIWGENGFVSVNSLTKYVRYGLPPETLNKSLRLPSGEVKHEPQETFAHVSQDSVDVEFLDHEWAFLSGLLKSGKFDMDKQRKSDTFIARFFEEGYL